MTPAEFKSYYDQFFDPVRRYLYFRSGDPDLSTDICQEVFLSVWEKRDRFKSFQIKPLLYKMAGDKLNSHYRRIKVRERHLESLKLDFSPDCPDQFLQHKELKQAYEAALMALPEKQRTVYLMNRLEELTYREIAERLDLSQKAIEKRMRLALTTIKGKLKQHEI
ncbi:MAG: sigma-70 family RNA polymerase sigma factor [Bacteroidota bacterium]